jgi:hypothetical protein
MLLNVRRLLNLISLFFASSIPSAALINGYKINWYDAKSYCENYRSGGYTDLRMPTLDELAGFYDASKSQQAECNSSFLQLGVDLRDTRLRRQRPRSRRWRRVPVSPRSSTATFERSRCVMPDRLIGHLFLSLFLYSGAGRSATTFFC